MSPLTSMEMREVEACRARVDREVAAYETLSTAAAGIKGAARTQVCGALVALEPHFFNDLVVVLASSLPACTADLPAPLDEVRAIARSVVSHDAVMADDVDLSPAESVLGLKPGDPVALTEQDFRRLSSAFFDVALHQAA